LEHETRSQTAVRRKELPQTPRALKTIELASKYAASRGQDFVGTEHLLIGLCHEGENVGTMVLKNLGVDLAKPRELFESMVPAQAGKVRQTSLTDRSRAVLRLSQEQAIGMGHGYV